MKHWILRGWLILFAIIGIAAISADFFFRPWLWDHLEVIGPAFVIGWGVLNVALWVKKLMK